MLYLSHFTFPHKEQEYDFFMQLKRTCYDSSYPFQIISKHGLRMLDFEPVTILYGGNGSGKTTVLNVIAEKLHLARDTRYNRSNFFEDYTKMCSFEIQQKIPKNSRIITSDDVFDFMLNLRALNDGIDEKREELFQEYLDAKYSKFQMRSLEDSARFFGCQFIIATHSPFLLSMRGAKIYDMDEEPVDVKPWTDLANVRIYYEFFKKHESELNYGCYSDNF